MELRHLRYFATVAEEKTFSRASARLRISQPAVSRQIKDLEEELGVSLFIRHGPTVSLTPAGEAFLAHARDVLRRAARAAEEMKTFQKNTAEKFSIGYIAPVLAGTLTPALRCFEQKHPQVELNLVELTPPDQIEALRSGRIDVAFIGNACPALQSEFNLAVLQEIQLQAVLPDNHHLALRKELKLTELADEPFVGFSERALPGRNDTICGACQEAGFTPAIRFQAESLSAALALIAAGKGVTLMPEEVSRLSHLQTVFVPLNGLAPYITSVAASAKGNTR
ncbi:MAG TPA: LysR substrate-binding domain-containing protein, partial [Verrucomicrobiae bacterium]|nr:LysR substrate-binding domain-containing protein [Verrucomicrobiae bacterium]